MARLGNGQDDNTGLKNESGRYARQLTIPAEDERELKSRPLERQPHQGGYYVVLNVGRQQVESENRSHLPTGRLTGPVRFVAELCSRWRLGAEQAAVLLGFEKTDVAHVEAILSGRVTLRGRDAKDRIASLLHIKSQLSSLFREEEAENKWLRSKLEELKGKAPIELLLEGSMQNLLRLQKLVDQISGK